MHKNRFSKIYNKSTMNIIIFGCLIIILSILITGFSSYKITQKAVITKLKERDLIYILKSIAAQVDGRIQRAKETSLVIADDPVIKEWFLTGETHKGLEKITLQKIKYISNIQGYSTVFLANKKTNHYWTSSKELTDTLSQDDSADNWFFETIKSNNKLSLNIDYNAELNNTLLWINTLMGNPKDPIGIAGVGVNLKDITNEFVNYKIGENSSLWLINKEGNIELSDYIFRTDLNIDEFLPRSIIDNITKDFNNNVKEAKVTQYINEDGKIIDLIYQPLKTYDWILVFQIDRGESVDFVENIKIYTIVTVIITIICILFLFFIISSKIANPYKRAVLLNSELEEVIEERTNEIKEKNKNIMDSIEYAKKIQRAMLSSSNMTEDFDDYFILYKPRDIVGGDFYYSKKIKTGSIIILGDCTGHGVPGALMTMTVYTILNGINMEKHCKNPASIIAQVDTRIKEALNKSNKDHSTDDGLDIGVCYIENHEKLYFAGAGISLYKNDLQQINVIKSSNKGIGYKNSRIELIQNIIIDIQKDYTLYMTTDGFIDQNGGEKNYSFGKTRFINLLKKLERYPLKEQKTLMSEELGKYMGDESQRDDIAVIAFKIQ